MSTDEKHLSLTLRRKASRYGEPEPILGIARTSWPQCGCTSRSESVEVGPERQLHTAVGCSNSNGAFDAIGDLGLQAWNFRIKLNCLYKMKISISQASEYLTSYLIPRDLQSLLYTKDKVSLS